jgi:hypothetical protein
MKAQHKYSMENQRMQNVTMIVGLASVSRAWPVRQIAI